MIYRLVAYELSSESWTNATLSASYDNQKLTCSVTVKTPENNGGDNGNSGGSGSNDGNNGGNTGGGSGSNDSNNGGNTGTDNGLHHFYMKMHSADRQNRANWIIGRRS